MVGGLGMKRALLWVATLGLVVYIVDHYRRVFSAS